MIKHCPQLRTQLQELKSLFSKFCLEFEQAKNTKEYEQVLGIEAQITKIILELRIKVDLDDLSQEYITEIERKNKANIPLTKAEINFLYNIDYTFYEYINRRDPKIQELLAARTNIKADLALLIGCPKEQISITPEEALSGNIKFHYGHLNLIGLTSATALKLPDSIGGSLYLHNLTSAKDLKLPASIGFDLDLQRLTSAKDLKLPDSIGGYLDLHNLTSAKDLKLPDSVGYSVHLNSLSSEERDELRKKYPNLKIVP